MTQTFTFSTRFKVGDVVYVGMIGKDRRLVGPPYIKQLTVAGFRFTDHVVYLFEPVWGNRPEEEVCATPQEARAWMMAQQMTWNQEALGEVALCPTEGPGGREWANA